MKSLDPIRLGGIILAVALSLALSACSALKLGYSTLPDLTYWWLDGYVDFNDAQEPQVRADLARLHAWHRQQELPRFAEVLGKFEQLAPGEITPQQACGVFDEVRARFDVLAEQAEPAVLALAGSLQGEQLHHIERKFRKVNDKFRKEFVAPPPAERQDRRFEQMLERIEMVYGRLDEPQRAVLRQGIAQSAYDAGRILADRQRRQQELLQVLRKVSTADAPPADTRAQLRGWLERAQRSPDPAYRAWQEGLVQEGCRIFAAVHQSTTPAQREHAVRRLRGYQRDLRELAARSR